MIGSCLYTNSESLLFERTKQPVSLLVSDSLALVRISPSEKDLYTSELHQAGVGNEMPNFDKGAVCYLAQWDGVPVGFGWCFASSPLLTRAGYGPDAVYLGGFSVREPYRGRGIYPVLLQQMCADLPNGAVAVVQTSPTNQSSINGLRKAGYEKTASLSSTIILGIVVQLEVTNLRE